MPIRSHGSWPLIKALACRHVLVAALAAGVILVAGPAGASFEAGLRAYEAKDYRKAFQVWQEAARGGNAKAQHRLGQLYEAGLGVPQNFVEAHRWYNLAAADGETGALQARDALAKKMTPEQIAAAQRLAADWTPNTERAPMQPTKRVPGVPSPAKTQAGNRPRSCQEVCK